MGVVEKAFDRGFLDGAVHEFDLSIRPGMIRLGESAFDSVDMAGAVKGMAPRKRAVGPWRQWVFHFRLELRLQSGSSALSSATVRWNLASESTENPVCSGRNCSLRTS